MSKLVNQLYKSHGIIYKLILYVAVVVFIVYLFPKNSRFKYDFERGKPWQFENLYAPFNFAIKKSNEEIKKETDVIKAQTPLYFNRDATIKSRVLENYKDSYVNLVSDSSNIGTVKQRLYNSGTRILNSIYTYGFLSEPINTDKLHRVILLENNVKVASIEYEDLVQQSQINTLVEKNLDEGLKSRYLNTLTALLYDIVVPNLEYSETLTNNALAEKLSKISYTRGVIERQTLIISKGEVVDGGKFKILKSLEDEYQSQTLSKKNYVWVVIAYTILVALALLMLLLFLKKYRSEVYNNNTKVTFILFNIVLMVVLTVLVLKYNTQYIYVVPLCTLPLILKAFFDARLGLFAHVITVLILGSIVPNSYEYMFLQIIAGIVSILTVSELYKRANLFISVGQITLIYIVAYFAFYVIHESTVDNFKWETLSLFALCGLATLFVQPLIYAYEKLFGLVSDVSLLELSDTNTKLLKELANVAPGTFHHSLNVANLAEACANEIKANAMLIRVGALYHDIGKMKNPTFFTENQTTGINPHDDLLPQESAQIIVNHVINGIEIAKKNNLPDRVIDFIRTHHGTSTVYYFYKKALAENEAANKAYFSYPGPKPFSKETAILMMCDSVEAASKSLKEPTTIKIDAFVENIITKQMEDGQFLNADITFKEIQLIKKVLKSKLANIYHLRIEYPE